MDGGDFIDESIVRVVGRDGMGKSSVYVVIRSFSRYIDEELYERGKQTSSNVAF